MPQPAVNLAISVAHFLSRQVFDSHSTYYQVIQSLPSSHMFHRRTLDIKLSPVHRYARCRCTNVALASIVMAVPDTAESTSLHVKVYDLLFLPFSFSSRDRRTSTFPSLMSPFFDIARSPTHSHSLFCMPNFTVCHLLAIGALCRTRCKGPSHALELSAYAGRKVLAAPKLCARLIDALPTSEEPVYPQSTSGPPLAKQKLVRSYTGSTTNRVL
jgi:hypothetical protein